MNKDEILDTFASKMRTSGYNVIQTREVIISGIRSYNKKKQESEQQGTTLNNDLRDSSRRLQRLIKRRTDKTSWYKKIKDKKSGSQTSKPNKRSNTDFRKTVTVFSVPRTHNGALAQIYLQDQGKSCGKGGGHPQVPIGEEQPLE